MKHIVAGLTLPALLGVAPALAADETVLDYRDHAFVAGSPFYSAADRTRLGSLMKEGDAAAARDMGDNFAVLGDAEGAFTGKNASERIYLIQKSAPVAINPFPQGPAPALLVTRGGKFAAIFRLPRNVQYQRLVAAADGNGDGRDEVLLETTFMNMGQMVSSVDVVGLGGNGDARVTQKLPEVHVDACDNPSGKRERVAATIAIGAGGFEARPHAQKCS